MSDSADDLPRNCPRKMPRATAAATTSGSKTVEREFLYMMRGAYFLGLGLFWNV